MKIQSKEDRVGMILIEEKFSGNKKSLPVEIWGRPAIADNKKAFAMR